MVKIDWYIDPKDESLHMQAHKTEPNGATKTAGISISRQEMFACGFGKDWIDMKVGQIFKQVSDE